MQNLIDNQGRNWPLIKISDKVGQLNDDGSIKVVGGFLARIP